MSDRINRREEIINAAASLFFEKGYADTSIQQIVDQVGCTKPALYYHFKDGKEALLREVLQAHFPCIANRLEKCSESATSLEAFIECYLRDMSKDMGNVAIRVRWLIAEFPRFNADERAIVLAKLREQILTFATFIERYTQSKESALNLAALIVPYFVGYSQLFIAMELHHSLDLVLEDQLSGIAHMIVASQRI
ncbi:MAG: TetR/AcrR family transcriptional regulator [Anaerolineae bacterium]|nr:TetR/AcrR family transcriptional regulator [Anaerolineae bacterium]